MANCTCKKWGCESDCLCACHREPEPCSDELAFEIRANFEEPEKVINVITGKYVISGEDAFIEIV